MTTVMADAIAEWHRQNDAGVARLTREADRKRRKAVMAKKRNPRNATAVIAARASKARDAILLARIKRLEDRVKKLERA